MSSAAVAAPRSRKSWLYHVIMGCVHVGVATIYRTRFKGREFLPRTGGVLIAANHQSYLDIPLIAKAARGRHVTFVARDTLMESRPLRLILRSCQAILIKRGGGDRAALRAIAERLAAGECVAIFPEGTRTRDGRVGAFKRGALVAARTARVPIVPCGIRGSARSWPCGASFPRPTGGMSVELALPVDPRADGALERVREIVVGLVDGTEQPDSDNEIRAQNT